MISPLGSLPTAAGEVVTPNPRSAARIVLVAERDQTVRSLQRHFLELAGFVVEFAENGLAAYERAREIHPLAVVTEILMPGMDGLTLCRRLRDDPLTHAIPVVVFSLLSAAPRAADAGAYAFLRKPLVQSSFVGAIERAVAAAAVT